MSKESPYGTIRLSDITAGDPFEHAARIAKTLTGRNESMLAVSGLRVLSLSTDERKKINTTPQYLDTTLKQKRMPWEGVTALIHNHPGGETGVSSEDRAALAELRKLGFKGKYMIYAKGRFIEIKD